MAIIDVPLKFSLTSVKSFKLSRKSNTIRSKYSAIRQTVIYPYAMWMLDVNLVEYQGEEARKIRSFLVQLQGQKNKFKMPVPGHYGPSTGYTGNALVKGAVAARATSFVIDGLTPNVPILGDGDYITVNDELKMLTADIASNGSGEATIQFEPFVRKPIADNFHVELQDVYCLMHAEDDDVADWGISPPNNQKVRLEAVEAIEA